MYLLKSRPNINCPGERLETSALCTFVAVHLCPLTHLSTLIIDRFGEVLLKECIMTREAPALETINGKAFHLFDFQE